MRRDVLFFTVVTASLLALFLGLRDVPAQNANQPQTRTQPQAVEVLPDVERDVASQFERLRAEAARQRLIVEQRRLDRFTALGAQAPEPPTR